MSKVVLSLYDGFSLTQRVFNSLGEAKSKMNEEYHKEIAFYTGTLKKDIDWERSSYDKNNQTQLFINDGTVLFWSIIVVEGCQLCGYEQELALYHLTDGDGTKVLCPNCICKSIANHSLSLLNTARFCDEITGIYGAVKFENQEEKYFLEADTMLRLLSHNLKPEEYKALVKIHGDKEFMLHDDFYTEDGIAIQPLEGQKNEM